MADAFEVSLDYMAGGGVLTAFYKKTIRPLEEFEQLQPDMKDKFFYLAMPLSVMRRGQECIRGDS